MFISIIVVKSLVVEGVGLLLSVVTDPLVIAVDVFESSTLFVIWVVFSTSVAVAAKDVVVVDEIRDFEVCVIGVVSIAEVASIIGKTIISDMIK